jgi:GNAT superfamily N-acetyltransferase
MRQPEPKAVHGPETATLDDVDGLNDIFATSFTDRYRRDGMAGVRVPRLNADIWRYAIEDAAAGALLWRDSTGDIIAFNMVHQSGTEGWMGPLAVRPERQSEGLGKRIVQAGVDWLKEEGASTIGLETMPRTVENIGFYSRLDFAPGYLTITVVRDVARRQRPPGQLLSSLGVRRAAVIEDCRRLAGELARGVDYTREIDLTARLGIGDTSIVTREGQVSGYALWHSAPLAEARPRDELRVLKVVAQDLDAFEQLLMDVQARCHANRMRRISLRCQSQYVGAYRMVLDHGFHTHWTDLRMTLHSHGEIHPETGVLFSNWEI